MNDGMIFDYEKKMNMLIILEVLRVHTDSEDNSFAGLNDIAAQVEKDYGVKIDRHALVRNLSSLQHFLEHSGLGYTLENEEKTIRKGKTGEEEIIYTKWHLLRDITDAELHLLIDSLSFSKYISYSDCKELVEKLKNLSSRHFHHRHSNLSESQPENKLLYAIDIINEAIHENIKISFQFVEFGADKKPRLVTGKDGAPHTYRVSPYEIVITNGRHYLICAHDKGGLFNYRIDYIREIKTDKEAVFRPVSDIPGNENGLILSKYMKEHIYMYGGKSERVTFRADENIAGQIIDWFGKDVLFANKADGSLVATVTVNENAMLYWALQYGMSVEILQPAGLRERVREAVKGMAEKYGAEP
jgi:predicted DNA-binding transcriptional regulator YafY